MNNHSDNQPSFDPANWDEFCDLLKQTGREILAHTPDDGLDQTEGFRYLARLTQYSLGRVTERPNPLKPQFSYNSARIGGDNPDYLYGSANITGQRAYRIWGNREQAFNIGFGSYYGGLGSGKGLQCSGYIFLDDLKIDCDGNFEIIVSEREHSGNWLPLVPESNSILVRQTVLNRVADKPAELQIELLEAISAEESVLPPLEPEEFTRSLKLTGLFVSGVIGQFLGWTNNFKERPNEIHPIDPKLLQFAQGDPNTRYHNGYFDLNDDEALLVELEPPVCEYWNLQVANHWLESLDYMDYQTSLNQASAIADEDGKVRILISAQNPGIKNWINTAGHRRGCIAMRWIKANSQSLAKCKVIKLEEASQPLSELMN